MIARRTPTMAMCRACNANQYLTVQNTFHQHDDCEGGGLTPSAVEIMARTYHDWEEISRERDQPNWRRTVLVVDHADSIGLNAKIEIRTGTASGAQWLDVAMVDFRVRPEDTRALIAELTRIADLRGL
jgi:hypothetical protein